MIILFEPQFVVEDRRYHINDLENQDEITVHILAELRQLFPDPNFSFVRVVREQEGEDAGTDFFSIAIPDRRVSQHFRTLDAYSSDYAVTINGVDTESRLYFEPFYDTEHSRHYDDADLLPQAVRDELRLNGPKLNNIVLNNLDIDYTDYVGATFAESLLRSSTFTGTRLMCADFTDADLRDSHFENADMRMAILVYVNLSNATLTDAKLKYADLSNANLRGADLTGADLRYTNLVGTDFTGCILDDTLFWGSTMSEGTHFDEEAMANAISEPQPDDLIAIDGPQPQPQPQPQFQGIAYEIHNAFNKINMDRYMEIIDTVIDDTNVAEYKRDIVGYVERKFTEKIEELPFVNKERKLQELSEVLVKLGLSDLVRDERVQIQIGKTVDYVLLQTPEFIELYISGWLEDCAHAYEGASGLSCVKGIVERFITVNGTTLHEMCRETECSQDQLDLLKLFPSINGLDMNSLLKEWIEDWNKKLDKWSILTPDERKADLISFLTKKYTEAGFDIPATLNETVEAFNYVFEDDGQADGEIAFGGRRKNIKRKRKNKITRKVSKMYKRITKKRISKKCISKKHIKTISKRKNKKKTTRKRNNKKL